MSFLGALTLYNHVTGELSSEQYTDALMVARLVLDLLTSHQAGFPPDQLAQMFTDNQARSMEVHQASGMVSVQLGITIGAAVAVLRAHAYAEALSLREVATEVIGQRLKLDPLDG